MRRVAAIIILCVVTLSAMAQSGWMYDNGKAGIVSDYEFIKGNYDQPTRLVLTITVNNHGDNIVLAVLKGECDIHDFRENQQYVVMEFDVLESKKWEIAPVPFGERKFNAFLFGDADALIEKLKDCETFAISLPLYDVGVQKFYFHANGYPLDW